MKQFLCVLAVLFLSCSQLFALETAATDEIKGHKEPVPNLEKLESAQAQEEPIFKLEFMDQRLILSGALEIEANYSKTRGEDATSDLTLATAELTAEALVNKYVSGHLTLLYEEDPNDESIKVDDATVTLHFDRRLFGQTPALTAGKLYLPFGRFNSAMISDPLTLELGETNDTAAMFALEGEIWALSAAVFNGAVDSGDDTIDSLVAALDITPVEGISLGVSYMSDLAESDAELVDSSTANYDSVAAISAYVSASIATFGLEAEVLGALEDFDAALPGSSDLTGRKPVAWFVEGSWAPQDRLLLAVRIEGSRDYQDDLTRYGATASYALFPQTAVACEYLYTDPETGDSNQTITAQLAFEF